MANGEQIDEQLYMLVGLQTVEGKRFRAVGMQGGLKTGIFDPKPHDRSDDDSMARSASFSGGGGGPNAGDTFVGIDANGEWMYVSGDSPNGLAGNLVAGAPGSAFAMQMLASTNGTVTRVVIFESSSGNGYVRFDWQRSDTNVLVPQGYYVDVVGSTIGTPAVWDTATVPGAQALMDQINAAIAVWGL